SMQISGGDPIQSNLTGSPAIDVLSGGQLTKTGGALSTVSVPVNIAATAQLSTNGGSIQLAGGGTSTGGMNPTQATDRIEIGGTPIYALNAGVNVTGSGRIAVV